MKRFTKGPSDEKTTPIGFARCFNFHDNHGAAVAAAFIFTEFQSLQQKWERKPGDGASLSVDGSELYANVGHGRGGELVRLDLTNGQPTLIKKLPNETGVWLAGQTLYEIGKTSITATDLRTNQEKWSRSKGWQCEVLSISDQSISFTCNDRVVHAVDLQTGAESLQIKTKLWHPAPPATANGVTYIAGDNNRLYALK